MADQAAGLPELAGVWWRPRMDVRRLDRLRLAWLATTLAHVLPFCGTAALLLWLDPITAPVALAALAHAWVIPALYAQRGANVVRPKRTRTPDAANATAMGLLGDLVGHDQRGLLARTGLVVEDGRLGTWVLGMGGGLLVRRGGRTVHCWCIGTTDPDLPPGDRIAHLLLALRSDETGLMTVANQAFAGAPWRVRARLRAEQREALETAVRHNRGA